MVNSVERSRTNGRKLPPRFFRKILYQNVFSSSIPAVKVVSHHLNMLVLLLTYLTYAVYFLIFFYAFAIGLYFTAELVEEYTRLTGRIIRYLILGEIVLHALLILFEPSLPWWLTLEGLALQFLYLGLLRDFPAFRLKSPGFVLSMTLLVVQHWLAVYHFVNVAHEFQFMEVLSYYVCCVWPVPVLLLVSLSANDLVLPQMNPLDSGGVWDSQGSWSLAGDFVVNKRKGLLYYCQGVKDFFFSGLGGRGTKKNF